MALITAKNVTIIFDGVAAVKDVSFQIERGDYMVMVGENGSGKSTLMRAMLGLVKPAGGTIVYGEGLKRSRIGYLPQQTAAQRDFPASVEEVVCSGFAGQLGMRPFLTKSMRVAAEEKMRMMDILPLRDRSYRNLSGGQQQRTLLARALCAADSVLLLDEPVTGLDYGSTEEMYTMIRRLNQEMGITVVMVSHDMRAARREASKLLVVDHGIEYFGEPNGYDPN